jgi:hypothetical protein
MFKFLKRLIGDRTEIVEGIRAAHSASEALTLEEAEGRAIDLLANPSQYRVEPGGTDTPNGMPPGLRRLFSRYRSIRSSVDELEMGLHLLSPSSVKADYSSLGYASEHTHLAVGPVGETVYVLADDVPEEEAVESVHASIYHYLVYRDLLGRPLSS